MDSGIIRHKKSAGPYGSALKSVDELLFHHATALPLDPRTTRDTNRIRRRKRKVPKKVLCAEVVIEVHNTAKN